MSKNEGVRIPDTQNVDTIVDKVAKACPQSAVRRKLADISNLPQKQRLLIQEEKSQSIPTNTKEYIDQLQKEHMALVKMLAQRNKIIEQSGIELDRLRVNLLKLKEQNHQLALQNSQMLADLNSGKDRLKALQHELGCKNGLLKARKLELEDKAPKRICKDADTEEGDSLKECINDVKPRITKRSSQSNGLGCSETVQSKENAVNKRFSFFITRETSIFPYVSLFLSFGVFLDRPCVRRQSARFKAAEQKHDEEMHDIDDTKLPKHPLLDNPVPEKESSSVKNEDNECSSGPGYESQDIGRPSLCRPSRVAAKKVQSYKEIPINVKMRRPQ
ncbi:hypothetical protein ACJIZ3_022864 [Penstemon smallii]|uniref:Shugoshin C-terminal domain-containing protein n=1 Tax=Penstemon smallii TaxID=265156 RepID=A0ABD3TPS1_9LAMI